MTVTAIITGMPIPSIPTSAYKPASATKWPAVSATTTVSSKVVIFVAATVVVAAAATIVDSAYTIESVRRQECVRGDEPEHQQSLPGL